MHTDQRHFLESLARLRFCDQEFNVTAKTLRGRSSDFEQSDLAKVPLEHRRMKAILGRMSWLMLKGYTQDEAPGMLLKGQSGAGKSSIIEWFLKRNPMYEEDKKFVQPVVRASVPPKPDVSSLGQEILNGLGDPYSDSSTKESRRRRIYTLMKNLGVKLLILDEVQHFVDHGGASALEVTNWFKMLVSETQIPVVLVGLPRSEDLLTRNEQMARRFPMRCYLEPFHHRSDYAFHEFRGVLSALQKRITVPCIPLHHPDVADRLLMATHGLMGHIISLLDAAVDTANYQGCEIDLSILAIAFNEVVWRAPDALNPFLTNEPLRSLRGIGEPFEKWDTSYGAGAQSWLTLH